MLTCIPFFGEVISRHGLSPDPAKVKPLTDMPPSKTKRELKSFLGIVNYLNKFSPMTAEVCKPLRGIHQSMLLGPGTDHTKKYMKEANHGTPTKKTKRNMRPKHKCQCYQYSSGPASMYINMTYTRTAREALLLEPRHISCRDDHIKKMMWNKAYKNIGPSHMSWPWYMVWL